MTNTQNSLTTTGHFLNGVGSSLAMLYCLQPLNTTKTYIMSGKGLPPFSSLYRGTTSVATSIVPIQGISFLVQGSLVNRYFNGDRKRMTDVQKITIAALTAISTSPLATLFDRITIQCQLDKKGPFEVARKMVKVGGLPILFKGYFPSLYREVFFATALFGTIDIFADIIHKQLPSDWESRGTISSIAGKISAGALSGALSTPVDVVKTRMQADLVGKYPSTRKTISLLLKESGPKIFIKGMGTRSLLIGLSMLVIGYSKEKIPSLFPKGLYQ
jgi:hypothetical protein